MMSFDPEPAMHKRGLSVPGSSDHARLFKDTFSCINVRLGYADVGHDAYVRVFNYVQQLKGFFDIVAQSANDDLELCLARLAKDHVKLADTHTFLPYTAANTGSTFVPS